MPLRCANFIAQLSANMKVSYRINSKTERDRRKVRIWITVRQFSQTFGVTAELIGSHECSVEYSLCFDIT